MRNSGNVMQKIACVVITFLLMHGIPGEAKCRRGKIVFTCDFYLGMDPGPLFSGTY